MGTWGTGLYSDDTTSEVRDQFRSHLASGLPPTEAEARILARYNSLLDDHQVACLVFFALADVEWRLGCMSDAVRQRALDLLDRNGDLEHWATEAPRDVPARRRTLNALRERLLSPQPPWKPLQIKKRADRSQLDLPIGSVLRLNLPEDHFALLKLVGFLPVGQVATALFRVLPWCSVHMPTMDELQAISEQWVPLDGHHEFSILFDGRKKLTSLLEPIGVVLAIETPIDLDRWRAYGPEALLAMTASALAALNQFTLTRIT
jgi:hypothetical protein